LSRTVTTLSPSTSTSMRAHAPLSASSKDAQHGLDELVQRRRLRDVADVHVRAHSNRFEARQHHDVIRRITHRAEHARR
jgi:hypothetical protein